MTFKDLFQSKTFYDSLWDGEDPAPKHNVSRMTTCEVQGADSEILHHRSQTARNETHCYNWTRIKKNPPTNSNTKLFLYMHSLTGKVISLHLCSRSTELLLYSELHKLT